MALVLAGDDLAADVAHLGGEVRRPVAQRWLLKLALMAMEADALDRT